MVPKKFILALCCSIGAALPLTVMAQMPSQPPTGTSTPGAGGLSPTTPSGGMTPSTPSGGMTPTAPGGMPPASGGGMTPSTPGGGMPPASGGGMTPTVPSGGMSPASGGVTKPSNNKPSVIKTTLPTGAKVNVNTATLKQLIKVNGIGPATANKIISGRPYANLDELVTKKVMTQKQLTQLEPQIGL